MRTTPEIATLLILVACTVLATGCDRERRTPPQAYDVALNAKTVPWTPPETVAALAAMAVEERTLDLSDARRFAECWDLFELAGKPRETFPLPERTERALALASCEVEGSLLLDDGTRLHAWGTAEEEGSRVRDLRVAAWGPDGKLRWSTTLDRAKQAPNWIANFRRSFLIAVAPSHVCFGTLWEGETQAACVDAASGEDRWRGSLPFWSGMDPQPGEGGFFVADLSAMTKRYPFSGAEMRHLQLDGLGGRAGYYASDGHRLYYAGSREEKPSLVAYDFEKFAPIWQTPLPAVPAPAFAAAFDEVDRVLVKIGDVLYGIDTESGEIRWALQVGDDAPPVALHEGMLFLLDRQPEGANLLFAIDPETGKAAWKAETPTGTLRIDSIEGTLVLGSVRAVQHVRNLDSSGSARD